MKYAPTGIYELDYVNKRFKSVNKAMCQILGYTEEELLSLSPLDFLDEDGKRAFAERIRKDFAGEKVDETVEYKIIDKNGREICAVLNVAFTYGEGKATGALVIAYDITERKRMEEALRQSEQRCRSLHAELEGRVQKRTAELESRHRELQEFAFVASHDLSEPLRKIQMFGDVIVEKCRESLDAQSLDYLNRMQGAAKSMQALLSALLDYSRVSTKAAAFEPADLNEVAREALSNVEYWIRREGGWVQIENLPTVESDRSQMVRIFQNVLSNTLEYHPPGVAPFVRVCSAFPENSVSAEPLQLIFEDNGIGFEEKSWRKSSGRLRDSMAEAVSTQAWGWASASARRSWSATAGTSPQRARPEKDPHSSQLCRWVKSEQRHERAWDPLSLMHPLFPECPLP